MSASGVEGAVAKEAAPAVEKVAEKPAEKPAAQVVVQQQAKAPEPAKGEDTAGILAAMKAEREALAAEREALRQETAATRNYREAEIATDRLAFVRSMPGLAVDFSDEHLAMLIPADANPRTEAGKAKLVEWREKAGARYFVGPAAAPKFDEDAFAERVVGGKENAGRRLFGAAHVKSMLSPPPVRREE